MKQDPNDKIQFEISRRDAQRVVDGLELNASWDKTEIYYKLCAWLKEGKT